MRQGYFLYCLLCAAQASAAPAPPLSQLPPVIPLHQHLVAVDYFSAGRQSGCGLRMTGEPEENVWINVLVSVFLKETGLTFGIFKVAAKKTDMKDGVPLLQDGRITYSSTGKIHKAWLRTESGEKTRFLPNGKLSHNDGYMATMDFAGTMDLLAAIPQGSIRVGIVRNEESAEDIFEFNELINPLEASKLLTCMKNLRNAIEEGKRGKNS